ncbi:molybdopterin-dependent oxidoreductase [Desulfonatronum sp. SC1]|uniref:molybdopterin-dependent oxidoreductase n=1 Tax=Desulfonatronum sp. SC1 TaxID=2109626 RepID=UPI000D317496|nr:molybdopterin-dependent oxidoreductase [Desulfonatronum sp. SC1]PTN32444.1 nitrate reductase [Desulfonatronum sp. SC1]
MLKNNGETSRISACILDCPDACSFLVDSRARTLRANPAHPFTNGFICRKGARCFDRLDAPERITRPLVRTKPKRGLRRGKAVGLAQEGFEAVSWDGALDVIADKLNALADLPEAVLHVRGHGYRGVLAQASLNLFSTLGSSTIHGSLCDEAGIEACIRDFGALEHNDPSDLLNAARIVNWGKDLGRSSPHTGLLVREARKRGTRVLTISPGGDGSEGWSDRVIRIRPGTDRFLAAWLIRRLMELDGISQDVVRACADWEAFRALVMCLNPEDLLLRCDVERSHAEELLEWYAPLPGAASDYAVGPTATLIGWGVQRYLYGGQNVRFINALSLLSGNIGRVGGGSYFNIASGRNLGSWRADSPGRPVTTSRRSFPLPSLAWELEWADPPVEFVWVDGHNVVNQVPDSLAMAKALQRPFVVCVEAFFNDTARCADVILPPALMLEREEIVGSCLHHYVNYSGQAVLPRGECRADYDILRDLGARLSPPVRFPEPDECLRIGLVPVGVDLDAFRAKGFARTDHPSVAFEGLKFAHPDGLYRFPEALDPDPLEIDQDDDPEFPLRLLSLVRGTYMHSQIPESEQQGLPEILVSPDNPDLDDVDPEGPIFLATPLGRMAVRIRLDASLHPHAVVIRRDGWVSLGHGPNAIIEPQVTDMGDCAALYSQCCRLESD